MWAYRVERLAPVIVVVVEDSVGGGVFEGGVDFEGEGFAAAGSTSSSARHVLCFCCFRVGTLVGGWMSGGKVGGFAFKKKSAVGARVGD